VTAQTETVAAVARGLRAGRDFINVLPLADGASRRAIDREFITAQIIPEGLQALDVLSARLAALEEVLWEGIGLVQRRADPDDEESGTWVTDAELLLAGAAVAAGKWASAVPRPFDAGQEGKELRKVTTPSGG
jgi:hypothetical protein